MFENFINIKYEPVDYNCAKHGFVKTEKAIYPNGRTVCECPKCIAEEEAKELQAEKEKDVKVIQKYYESCNIEKEYWDATFDDYKPETDSQKKAIESVSAMIKNKSGKIIMMGSNGVGKTMLGSIAVKELGGKIYSMYEISTMIRQSYTSKAEKTELEIVKELASIPLLVIDELGRTKGSDAELNWLSYVLDKRHTRNLPFMILTNTHLMRDCKEGGCSQCFENFINNDILSRLRQNTDIITIQGPDFRSKK